MTTFLLMRHGAPDFSGPDKWTGRGGDLAPLTAAGEEQVVRQLGRIREFDPEIVISSPMTRALQCALILRAGLSCPFKVEFDLHEWVPDRSFQWRGIEDVKRLQAEFYRLNGEWPPGETRPWEPQSSVRSRGLTVFRKYLGHKRVLAVCHGQIIKSVTSLDKEVDFASLVPLELTE